ncbi:MAG: hypothetical protein J3K34DRAFT_441855 [Monoraphidium minutum]|nr:MAG: hypothetical protein J3K34DRAFT_441855 [Monoraphidium minutum]
MDAASLLLGGRLQLTIHDAKAYFRDTPWCMHVCQTKRQPASRRAHKGRGCAKLPDHPPPSARVPRRRAPRATSPPPPSPPAVHRRAPLPLSQTNVDMPPAKSARQPIGPCSTVECAPLWLSAPPCCRLPAPIIFVPCAHVSCSVLRIPPSPHPLLHGSCPPARPHPEACRSCHAHTLSHGPRRGRAAAGPVPSAARARRGRGRGR